MTPKQNPNLVIVMLSFISLIANFIVVVIPVVLVFYAIFLIMLAPAEEKEPASNRNHKKSEKLSVSARIPHGTVTSTKKEEDAKPTLTAEAEKLPKESGREVQTKPYTEPRENVERQKGKKEKKSFFLFGNSNFKGCSHEFGHLKNVPKSTPIPDECFGCPRILECLTNSKNNKS